MNGRKTAASNQMIRVMKCYETRGRNQTSLHQIEAVAVVSVCNANDRCCLLGPVYFWLLNNWIKSICGGWWSRVCCFCCLAITLFRIRIELWWWMQFYGLYKAKRNTLNTKRIMRVLLISVYFVCLPTCFIYRGNFFRLLISLLVYDLPIAMKHALLYKQTVHLIGRRPTNQPATTKTIDVQKNGPTTYNYILNCSTFSVRSAQLCCCGRKREKKTTDFVYISDACVSVRFGSVCMFFGIQLRLHCLFRNTLLAF